MKFPNGAKKCKGVVRDVRNQWNSMDSTAFQRVVYIYICIFSGPAGPPFLCIWVLCGGGGGGGGE